jgi:hypothetical protein
VDQLEYSAKLLEHLQSLRVMSSVFIRATAATGEPAFMDATSTQMVRATQVLAERADLPATQVVISVVHRVQRTELQDVPPVVAAAVLLPLLQRTMSSSSLLLVVAAAVVQPIMHLALLVHQPVVDC